MARTLTTIELSQTDKNLLEAIKLKTGQKSNVQVLRSLIRKRYGEVADKSKMKLAKEERLTPGKSMLFKLVQMRVIKKVNKGGRLTSRLMKFRRLTKDHGIKGKYKMSDGTIVKI